MSNNLDSLKDKLWKKVSYEIIETHAIKKETIMKIIDDSYNLGKLSINFDDFVKYGVLNDI
jgi:hypothetical protein